MEIKDFVRDTLVQIVTGIDEANKTLVSLDSFVASSNMAGLNCMHTSKNKVPHYVANVDFDIAVTTEQTNTAKDGVKFGISVVGVGLGMDLGSEHKGENQNQTISRIKFSLPLALPTEPEK